MIRGKWNLKVVELVLLATAEVQLSVRVKMYRSTKLCSHVLWTINCQYLIQHLKLTTCAVM